MTPTMPSDEAVKAAYSLFNVDGGSWREALDRAYAVDVAPLVTEIARLRRVIRVVWDEEYRTPSDMYFPYGLTPDEEQAVRDALAIEAYEVTKKGEQ